MPRSIRSDGRSPRPPRRRANCPPPTRSRAPKAWASGCGCGRAVVAGRPAFAADWGLEPDHRLARGIGVRPGGRPDGDPRRLGRRGPRGVRRLRHRQADDAGGSARPEAARSSHRPAHRRPRAAPRVPLRRRSASTPCVAGRPPGGQGRVRSPAAGRGRGRRDGGRRRQRRAGPRSGGSRHRDRHRHRRRDRGERPHARLRRPARRGRRDSPLTADAVDDQGQPVLGVRLQRRGASRSPRSDTSAR